MLLLLLVVLVILVLLSLVVVVIVICHYYCIITISIIIIKGHHCMAPAAHPPPPARSAGRYIYIYIYTYIYTSNELVQNFRLFLSSPSSARSRACLKFRKPAVRALTFWRYLYLLWKLRCMYVWSPSAGTPLRPTVDHLCWYVPTTIIIMNINISTGSRSSSSSSSGSMGRLQR